MSKFTARSSHPRSENTHVRPACRCTLRRLLIPQSEGFYGVSPPSIGKTDKQMMVALGHLSRYLQLRWVTYPPSSI